MADIFTKEKRSDVMSRIRPKNTKPELIVFRYLRKEGIYFQKHYRRAPAGTPDIAVPIKKIAVFIDGDFWHGYRFPQWKHKLPKKYWQDKIQANIARDRRIFAKLRRNGWKVLRIWEHNLAGRNRKATLVRTGQFVRGGGSGTYGTELT